MRGVSKRAEFTQRFGVSRSVPLVIRQRTMQTLQQHVSLPGWLDISASWTITMELASPMGAVLSGLVSWFYSLGSASEICNRRAHNVVVLQSAPI